MGDDHHDVPRGGAPEPQPNRGAREDRIAFGVLLGLICLIGFGLIWGLTGLLDLLGIAAEAAGAGIGLRDAFLISIPISFSVIILFALVAGDGLIGELGAMLIGFFVMLLFFTGSIAILL